MSIRSKIAWTALGCVLLSGTAYAGDPTKPDPKHERDSRDKKARDKHERGNSAQPVDAAGMPVGGTGATDPVTGAAVVPAATLQQLGCSMIPPLMGMVPATGPTIELWNQTPTTLPAGTVVWMGPPGAIGSNGITSPTRGVNPDGTPGHMDRYFRLTSDVPAGSMIRTNYSPDPAWPGCAAVTGMTSLIAAVVFVQ